MLRALGLGLSIQDLDLVTIGMITDMATERSNDDFEYVEYADQSDFDAF